MIRIDMKDEEIPRTSQVITLRDYFAGQALPELVHQFCLPTSAWDDYGDLAKSAYSIADAMIAEREKR